jgi:hypothetical protein
MSEFDYPNSSETWVPEPPEERKQAERKEQEMVTSSVGVIKDVLEWLKENIDATDSLTAARRESRDRGISLEEMGTAFEILKGLLEGKEAEFKGRFAQYIEKDDADEA